MRCVVQRVSKAEVVVDKEVVGMIDVGYLVYVGIGAHDTTDTLLQMAKRIYTLRIMPDENGKMNWALTETEGSLLLVSQFTLLADTSSNRPSFMDAMSAEAAKILFEDFVQIFRQKYAVKVQTGVFGAHMDVTSINDGPVTIILEE